LISIVAINVIWILVEHFAIKLYLERRFPKKIEEDDFLGIEVVIENRGVIPLINFVLEDNLPCAVPEEREKRILLEYLRAKSSNIIRYSCYCPVRGKYELGPFSLYIFDPFGLFFIKKIHYIYSEVYVYPQTFNIRKFPILAKGTAPWFGIETSRVSGDEHEFYGVREYKPGDPIKKIHWLSTARKNKLIVKQFQRQVFFRVTILFNLSKDRNFGEGKKSVAEYTIKIAASVARYLIEVGVSLEIIAHVGEIVRIPFNKGPEHLDDIFRFLTVARPESKVEIDEIFHEFARYIPSDSSLVIIMPDTELEYLFAMLSIKEKNVSLIPLVLITSSFLYPSVPQQKLIKEAQIKFPEIFDFSPIFFSCGANLEEPFMRY
jgi:uncharacterized protein (DUF58 family)